MALIYVFDIVPSEMQCSVDQLHRTYGSQ
jgi:hypothetical protein